MNKSVLCRLLPEWAKHTQKKAQAYNNGIAAGFGDDSVNLSASAYVSSFLFVFCECRVHHMLCNRVRERPMYMRSMYMWTWVCVYILAFCVRLYPLRTIHTLSTTCRLSCTRTWCVCVCSCEGKCEHAYNAGKSPWARSPFSTVTCQEHSVPLVDISLWACSIGI